MVRVLITGGAGFIGSHATDRLLAAGYQVRLLDNLAPQVHGAHGGTPTRWACHSTVKAAGARGGAAGTASAS